MMWCSACSCFHEIWNVPKEWIHFYKQIQEKYSCTRIKILIHPDSVKRLLGRKCQLSQSSCRIPACFFSLQTFIFTHLFIHQRTPTFLCIFTRALLTWCHLLVGHHFIKMILGSWIVFICMMIWYVCLLLIMQLS